MAEQAMSSMPKPKSPPGLHSKRHRHHHHHHQVKLQLLEREIDFLQEELKSLDKIQPSSRCCKEINDFIATKSDPMIAVDQELNQSDCCSCSCRGIRDKSCCKSSWSCCISGCCRSDNEQSRKGRKNCCCSSMKKNCCGKKCGIKGCCSCFSQNCCLFKLCSSNCCKVKCCPNCVPSCSFCC